MKTKRITYFLITYSTTCLIFSGILIYKYKELTTKNKELEEQVYTLEQNNIDLNWQLGEVGQIICRED